MTMTSSNTASGPWVNNLNSGNDTMTMGATIVLVDPVASGLLDGNEVTEDTDAIAAMTNPSYVAGAAADGVTQVIVEVTGVQPGDTIQLTLQNELGQQDSEANDGGLFPLGGDPDNASSTLTITAQNTMAIAVWRAPANYDRNTQGVSSYLQDDTSVQRSLTLQAQDTSTEGSPNTVNQTTWVMRPPVVEIHGLWANADDWSNMNFQLGGQFPLWAQAGLVQTVDYSAPVPVTATSPAYSSSPSSVMGSALGFSYNAPIALSQTMSFIANYALLYNIAAVQADVIGHSMGGDIARTMVGISFFQNNNNYGNGYVHKLITIGTPHQGSPLAIALLPSTGGDYNSCVRNQLAGKNMISLQTATINGATVSGAVGDLTTGVSGTQPFPIAYIGATTSGANLSGLDCTFCVAQALRLRCPLDTLALLLNSTTWNQVFNNAGNDGIVPLTSQLNGKSSTLVHLGVIHSPGLKGLDFDPPTELDLGSGIPGDLINLLNEAINGPDFFTN